MADKIEIKGSKPYSSGVSDRTFFVCSIALFIIVILAMLYISSLFMHMDSAIYDTGRFYAMAKVIAGGAIPYIDYQDPKPPLIFFILTLPVLLGQQFLGGLFLVGMCNLISAILIMIIAREYYNRAVGLLAALLFLVNMGWAQGYFVMTEPFTILFILMATYFVLCGKNKHYKLSGLCAGIAIGFKQYALLTVPLLLMTIDSTDKTKNAVEFLIGVLIPLIAIFSSIFFIYGAQAMDASLYWSFGVAGPYIVDTTGDKVIGTRSDLFELAVNIIIAVMILVSLIIGLTRYGENLRRSPVERYLLFSAICFALTLVIRQYLHYWALAIPFLAILWAGWLYNTWKNRGSHYR
ncbi:MAG TPA: glycosyltransferase family 39 protein [Methanocella sp.]|nr:glycosyltransferase family 39 protein [Methanocella sp.]